MKRPLTLALFAALGGYYLVPFVAMQLASVGVYRRGSGLKPEVALTFDDGPDPDVTPQILDALEAAGARGTFFVLGEQVRKHPELVRQMLERGHELGVHGDTHRAAWLRTPWDTLQDMRKGLQALLEVTGFRPRLGENGTYRASPRFFRPAHGVYTAATWLGLRQTGLEAAGWTIEAHDWHAQFTPDDVLERILSALEPGGVVVMHDASLGAKNCVQVLPRLLEQMKKRGYTAKTLSEMHGLRMGGLRDVMQRLSTAQDRAWDRKNGIDALTQHSSGLLRIGLGSFPGVPGSSVPAGTPYAEIHLHSPRLVGVAEKPMVALRQFKFSLGEVARALEHSPRYAQAQGIYAVTFYAGILKSLGFQVSNAPNDWANRFGGLANNALRWIYSSRPNRNILIPQLAWMPRKELMRRYGKKEELRSRGGEEVRR